LAGSGTYYWAPHATDVFAVARCISSDDKKAVVQVCAVAPPIVVYHYFCRLPPYFHNTLFFPFHSPHVYLAFPHLSDAHKHTTFLLAQYDDGEEKTVKKADLQPLSRGAVKRAAKVADLTLLDNLASPLILHCLRERFKKQQIYTAVGTITISINPYQRLPIYTEDVRAKYINRGCDEEMPPHVYNNAHEAFTALTEFKKNQSVVGGAN
jgi:hypothetical protein